MGCCSSKSNALSHLDDSVKVMVRHDAAALARKGQKPGGYVPRAEHPMLVSQRRLAVEDGSDGNDDKENYVGSDGGAVEFTPTPQPRLVVTEEE
mmetsp:Transcript_15314/g.22444  ORF Transcript_15314/g.22444 Transcript_15314/m.22444 type:complete len:94 (+) Transcript_15314:103-384(+)|eukprot:CAMPEP_0197241086 /NCGR_PEP_ID=MMETSP1429-20130617/7211_1 /TAXON_ID=49237 /ORGANISM="Chaetoceros  sp., Strain UNC1202" /LENGTH=93 /DNA_ID=CAMNT_0042700855 /DNA_START=73 /DNA_END=354 /DNA_ORIENTATION=+